MPQVDELLGRELVPAQGALRLQGRERSHRLRPCKNAVGPLSNLEQEAGSVSSEAIHPEGSWEVEPGTVAWLRRAPQSTQGQGWGRGLGHHQLLLRDAHRASQLVDNCGCLRLLGGSGMNRPVLSPTSKDHPAEVRPGSLQPWKVSRSPPGTH